MFPAGNTEILFGRFVPLGAHVVATRFAGHEVCVVDVDVTTDEADELMHRADLNGAAWSLTVFSAN